MRLVMLFFLFCNGIFCQNPFDLIEQYTKQKSLESYSNHLEDIGYDAVPEDNTDAEQHYRSGNTNIFLTASTCNHIVITSTNPDFDKGIESELHEQGDKLTTTTTHGRKKHSWYDKLENNFFVLVNPNGNYELYYASCTNTKPLTIGQP